MNTQQTAQILYGKGPCLSLQELQDIPTPQPMGRFHNPVPFGDFASRVVQELDDYGLDTVHQEYQVAGSEDNPMGRFFGALEIQPKAVDGEFISKEDWKMVLGMRGSHDQSIKRGLVLGSQVMVCSNLCFSGDLGSWDTKQTINVDQRLPAMIEDAVHRIPEMHAEEMEVFERLRNLGMSPRQGDAALVELHLRRALPGPQLVKAIQEWHEPSHDEHVTEAGHDWSAWRLFNASTEALKPAGRSSNNFTTEKRSRIVHGFMSEVVGL